MSQQTILRDKEISYSGLFSLKDLYAIMDKFFRERGYEKNELNNEEHVKPDGKEIILHLMPVRWWSDYIRLRVEVEATLYDIQDVEVEKDGAKRMMQKGNVKMTVNAYIESDYEQKWEAKPTNFFLRTLFDKFVYRKYSHEYEKKVLEDAKDFCSEVKGFLNLNRY